MATSLRKTVSAEIGSFLLNNGFALADNSKNRIFQEELVSIANSLSDYYEEGTHLYPEVLLTNNIANIPFFMIFVFFEGQLEQKSLSRAIKMCAPLCNDGWSIFLEVNNDGIRWGMVNSEQKITSLSLLNSVTLFAEKEHTFALMHNIGAKTVEIVPANGNESYIVSLSLGEVDAVQNLHLNSLCEVVGEKCEDKLFCDFMEKTLGYALQIGHGNLIAVIQECDDLKIPNFLSEGVSLQENPLDLYGCYVNFKQSDKSLAAHEYLKKVTSLLVSMLNHDGICLFTNKGKLLGYHYIVDNNVSAQEVIVGGARTKAYKKLCSLKPIYAVLMKTQEGAIYFNKQNDETGQIVMEGRL